MDGGDGGEECGFVRMREEEDRLEEGMIDVLPRRGRGGLW